MRALFWSRAVRLTRQGYSQHGILWQALCLMLVCVCVRVCPVAALCLMLDSSFFVSKVKERKGLTAAEAAPSIPPVIGHSLLGRLERCAPSAPTWVLRHGCER
jgi:hypothetical protein